VIGLKGNVCVITGAADGIGAVLAHGFARRGATVIATSQWEPKIRGAAMNLKWDVTDPKRAEEVFAEVVREFGQVDAFVANAAIMPRQPWDEVSAADWRNVMSANLDGAWFGAQSAAKIMTARGCGSIVFVSSVEVEMGVALHCHYAASKAGLIGLARSLARAVGKDNVRVNCVMPGAVQTPSEAVLFPDAQAVATWCDERQCIPGRLQPEDVEPTFAFLCSDESKPITGQVICVDRGLVHY